MRSVLSELPLGERTLVMGILNITPDSFSGDGLLTDPSNSDQVIESALRQAREMISNGADILDVGGESTRPGAEQISQDDEIKRVIPVIRALSSETEILISIDTYKSQVAEAGVEAGASMINDVWGFKVDHNMANVAARYKVPVILMHNRSSWTHHEIKERLGGRYTGIPYQNLIEEVREELLESVEIALSAGVGEDSIILDPGIGFGKTVEQNLELINRLDEIKSLGYPLLLGTSRKSFIGYTLDLPPDDRLMGTAAGIAIGILRGADIIRVHDVKEMSQIARMTDAIIRSS